MNGKYWTSGILRRKGSHNKMPLGMFWTENAASNLAQRILVLYKMVKPKSEKIRQENLVLQTI